MALRVLIRGVAFGGYDLSINQFNFDWRLRKPLAVGAQASSRPRRAVSVLQIVIEGRQFHQGDLQRVKCTGGLRCELAILG